MNNEMFDTDQNAVRPLILSSFVELHAEVVVSTAELSSDALGILPDAHPSMLAAIAPACVLAHAQIISHVLADVGGRIAHVFASERLGYDVNGLVLLTPALALEIRRAQHSVSVGRECHSSQTSIARVQLRDTRKNGLRRVTVSSFVPFPGDIDEPAKVADNAKSALLHRNVCRGDLVVGNLKSWLVVTDIVGSDSECGMVTQDTDVALNIGGSRPQAIVTEGIRNWARAHWRSSKIGHWDDEKHVNMVGRCLNDGSLGIIALSGLVQDVRDVMEGASVGRSCVYLDGRTSVYQEIVEAIARTEIAGGRSSEAYLFIHHASGLDIKFTKAFAELARSDCGAIYLDDRVNSIQGPLGRGDRQMRHIRILVGCENIEDLNSHLRGLVVHEVKIPVASDTERRQLLNPHDDPDLVQITAGYARAEVFGMRKVACEARSKNISVVDAVKLFGKGKVTVDTGDVSWDDVGGLEDAKTEILRLVDLSSYQEACRTGEDRQSTRSIPRRVGVLLYGPPGTGKTLLAKAVARECGCSFISVKGPELLDMYVGESERNVRMVFDRAAAAAPCVVFFDELDALAPARGRSGADSGGVSDRVVSQLLSAIDDAADRNGIFIIAASNRPDLVDPSILRPGRFDKLIYVSTPQSRRSHELILKALTRRFIVSPNVDFGFIVNLIPDPPLLTGADLYAFAADAWLLAAKRTVTLLSDSRSTTLAHEQDGDLLQRAIAAEQAVTEELLSPNRISDKFRTEDEPVVEVSQADFESAATRLKPSLHADELAAYEDLRQRLEGG
jgi:ATP-dependent 26S proteasome regulatory subunit